MTVPKHGIEPANDERRAINKDVIRRNALRKTTQLQMVDVATTSRQEIALFRQLKFRHSYATIHEIGP